MMQLVKLPLRSIVLISAIAIAIFAAAPLHAQQDIGAMEVAEGSAPSGGDTADSSGVSNSGMEPDYFSGAATSRIDIEVPPGRNGMTPKVAISYDSRRLGRDSVVGRGWQLTESYIERSRVNGAPDYSRDDYISFANGQSMQLIDTGNAINDCTEYRLKVDGPDARIYYKCDSSWVVYDKDGKRYDYGMETKLSDGRGDFRWYLERIYDSNWNAINYQYRDLARALNNGLSVRAIVLSSISYVRIVAGDKFRISFEYTPRAGADPAINYSTGLGLYLPDVLTRITVNSDNTPVRTYDLEYEYDGSTPLLKAAQVTGIGVDGSSIALPKRQFSYNKLSEDKIWSRNMVAWVDPAGAPPEGANENIFIDMNGDGLVDHVVADPAAGGFKVYYNTGSGFAEAPVIWRDICTGSGFCTNNGMTRTSIMDVNGDGLPDRVVSGLYRYQNAEHYGYFIRFNNGKSWDWQQIWTDPICEPEHKRGNAICGEFDVVDLNGDGLPDRISKDGLGMFYVYLNRGHGFDETPQEWSDPSNLIWMVAERSTFADLNGDGLQDRIVYSGEANSAIFVYYNDGRSWRKDPFQWNTPEILFAKAELKDVDSDGLPDLITSQPGGVLKIYRNLGNKFDLDNPIAPAASCAKLRFKNGQSVFQDIDGDGLADLACPAEDTYSIHLSDIVVLNEGGEKYYPPQILKGIDNGLGVQTTLSYRPSTHLDNRLMPIITYVLSRIETQEGVEEKRTDIDYASGQYYTDWWNVAGRRFNGFGFVRIRDHLGNEEQRWYRQASDVDRRHIPFIADQPPAPVHSPDIAVLESANQLDNQDHWGDIALSGKLYRTVRYLYNSSEARYLAQGQQRFHWLVEWNFLAPHTTFVALERQETFSYEGGADGNNYHTILDYKYDSTSGNVDSIIDYGWVGHDSSKIKRFVDYARIDTGFGAYFSSKPQLVETIDSNGYLLNRTNYIYNDKLNPITEKHLLISGGNQRDLVTTRTFGDWGNVTSTIEPLNRRTDITYDADGLYPARTTRSEISTLTTYDPRTGKLLRKETPDGRIATTLLDPLGRIKETAFQGIWKERYQYIDKLPRNGNRFLSKIIKFTNISSDPDSADHAREIAYSDGQGRVVQVSKLSERSNDSYRTIRTDQTFELGRTIIASTAPFFTANANFVELPGAAKRFEQRDGLGRVIRIDPLVGDPGSPTGFTAITYGYDGNPWAVVTIDPEGKNRIEERAPRDRIMKVREFVSGRYNDTRYTYDILDRLVSIADSSNNRTTFAYDSLSRRTELKDPDSGHSQFSYDDLGRLILQKDAKGQAITTRYDIFDRVTDSSSIFADGRRNDVIRYSYDLSANNAEFRVRFGELSEVTDSAGAVRYSYDDNGNIEKVARTIAGIPNQLITTQTTSHDNLVQTMTYPGERVALQYSYDRSGKLKEIRDTKAAAVDAILYTVDPERGYDAAGHLLKEQYGDGTKDEYKYYDNSKRLRSMATKNGANAELFARVFTYDRVANLKTISGLSDGTFVSNIFYDDLHRLTGYDERVNNVLTNRINYQYDALGNLIHNGESFANEIYTYGRPHGVTSVAGKPIEYDNGGNITTGRGRKYSYNARNQLSSVDMDNGRRVTYRYDYKGQRLTKEISEGNAPASKTFYLGQQLEIRGDLLVHNIFAGGKLIATIGRGHKEDLIPAAAAGIVRSGPSGSGENIFSKLGAILFPIQGATLSPLPFVGEGQGEGALAVTFAACLAALAIASKSIPAGFTNLKKSLRTFTPLPNRPLAFRFASIAMIAILLCSQSLNAYVFRTDVDDTWPTATDEFFSYIHSDILGSSSLYTEGLAKATHGGLRYVRGEAVQVVEYKPFGVERYVLNPLIEAGPRYTGQVFDLDTDLYYYNARYYDPVLGRFIQPDSIIQDPYSPQLLNPYSYVINNPLKYNDPSGNRVPIEVSTEDGGTELNSISQVDTGWDFFREGRDVFHDSSYSDDLAILQYIGQYTFNAIRDNWNLLTIFDPTPTSDVINITNDLANDDYFGVAFSALGIVPVAGDIIGKGARGVRGLSKETRMLAEANITHSGRTVLGHYPGYIEKAQRTGSSYFDIGDAWEPLTQFQRTAANRHFLDTIADSADRVYLSIPKSEIRQASSLSDEVQYLTGERGYQWINQWALRPPGN